jgi:type II secretory pathway component PulF
MSVLALTTNQELWWVTLAVGLVVALVVWFLLERLRREVYEVDRAVSEVWTMGKRVAQNTSTTYLLSTTKERGVELVEELGHHAAASTGEPS